MSFGEAFGELLRDLGGSGASPGGVCSQCFRQGGTCSENHAKKVPKGTQKGCQEALKISIVGGKIGTRRDLSVPWVTKSCHAEADRTQEVN